MTGRPCVEVDVLIDGRPRIVDMLGYLCGENISQVGDATYTARGRTPGGRCEFSLGLMLMVLTPTECACDVNVTQCRSRDKMEISCTPGSRSMLHVGHRR